MHYKCLSPIKIQGRFYNRSNRKSHPFMLRSLYMLLVSRIKRLLTKVNYKDWYAPEPVVQFSENPRITWIGHATFLVQIGGINILLDPLFGSPSFLFNRLIPPGIDFNLLPKIDAVLISHNHYDHMDAQSIQALYNKYANIFFVPYGDGAWFKSRGIHTVCEFEWWQQRKLGLNHDMRITFLPAHHWSARSLFDINKSLWGSWMIEYQGYKIYFAGDSAWDDHFEQIKNIFGDIDVALLPIGPCEPKEWMKSSHLNAEQAGQAAVVLNARHCIAMHWGTFGFGLDHFYLPIERIKAWWNIHYDRLSNHKLHILKVGAVFSERLNL